MKTSQILAPSSRSKSQEDTLPMTSESSEMGEENTENKELFNFELEEPQTKMSCSQQPSTPINEPNQSYGSSSNTKKKGKIATSPMSSIKLNCKTLIIKSLEELEDKTVHFQKLTNHMAFRHGFQVFNTNLIRTSLRELQSEGTVVKNGFGYYQVIRAASSSRRNTFPRVEESELSENGKKGESEAICGQQPARDISDYPGQITSDTSLNSQEPLEDGASNDEFDDTTTETLEDTPEPSETEWSLGELPDVQVEVAEGKWSNKSGRKLYRKLHFCPFCDMRLHHIIRHLEKKHSSIPEVKKLIEAGKKNELKTRLTALLKNWGNFQHNVVVLKARRGSLMVDRRPGMQFSVAVSFMTVT